MTPTRIQRKWHPILFKGDMVRAIQGGRKTQTRRVIRNLPSSWVQGKRPSHPSWTDRDFAFFDPAHPTDTYPTCFTCPYGVPGDFLWVRETWATYKCLDKDPPRLTGKNSAFWYRADSSVRNLEGLRSETRGKWRPSIHMPRWASRISLEVTGVRVERVQEIATLRDIPAEGVDCRGYEGHALSVHQMRGKFWGLWDSINAKRGYGWELNPWVFVIEFLKRTEGKE